MCVHVKDRDFKRNIMVKKIQLNQINHLFWLGLLYRCFQLAARAICDI